MGVLSLVLLGIFLVVLGVFLVWPTVVSSVFVGFAAIVTGAVVLIENFLWPRVSRRPVNG